MADKLRLALSVVDAAEAAGIGKSTLYELLADGKGPRTFIIGSASL